MQGLLHGAIVEYRRKTHAIILFLVPLIGNVVIGRSPQACNAIGVCHGQSDKGGQVTFRCTFVFVVVIHGRPRCSGNGQGYDVGNVDIELCSLLFRGIAQVNAQTCARYSTNVLLLHAIDVNVVGTNGGMAATTDADAAAFQQKRQGRNLFGRSGRDDFDSCRCCFLLVILFKFHGQGRQDARRRAVSG